MEKCWICLLFTHIVCAECEWLALLKQPSDIIYSDVCWIYKWAIMHVFKAIKEVKMHSVKKSKQTKPTQTFKKTKIKQKTHTIFGKFTQQTAICRSLYANKPSIWQSLCICVTFDCVEMRNYQLGIFSQKWRIKKITVKMIRIFKHFVFATVLKRFAVVPW